MKNFLIGAATAAHQVEGNNIHSDYWVMENLTHSSFNEPSLDAVDHYNRYKEDIKYLSDSGLNAYRFSIEWARIEPEEGHFDEKELQHYREMLEYCLSLNITPIVTLLHFSSPAWLISKGGWKKESVVKYFERYCAYIAKELGSMIPYICTMNEANMGYQLRAIAKDMLKANARQGDVQVGVNLDMKEIIRSMFEQGKAFSCSPFEINTFVIPRSHKDEEIIMRAHMAGCEAIKKYSLNTKIGLTLSLFDYQAVDGGDKKAKRYWYDDYGFYYQYIKDDDFLGVQNYSRKIVNASGAMAPGTDVPVTQMGYEEYAESIGNVLRKVSESFKGEIIVTENGIATDDDSRRCNFIRKAYASVLAAKRDGVNVKGYMYWSLLDNFEWQAGFRKTFGLIAVDRKTQTRYPKESMSVLGALAKGE